MLLIEQLEDQLSLAHKDRSLFEYLLSPTNLVSARLLLQVPEIRQDPTVLL